MLIGLLVVAILCVALEAEVPAVLCLIVAALVIHGI